MKCCKKIKWRDVILQSIVTILSIISALLITNLLHLISNPTHRGIIIISAASVALLVQSFKLFYNVEKEIEKDVNQSHHGGNIPSLDDTMSEIKRDFEENEHTEDIIEWEELILTLVDSGFDIIAGIGLLNGIDYSFHEETFEEESNNQVLILLVVAGTWIGVIEEIAGFIEDFVEKCCHSLRAEACCLCWAMFRFAWALIEIVVGFVIISKICCHDMKFIYGACITFGVIFLLVMVSCFCAYCRLKSDLHKICITYECCQGCCTMTYKDAKRMETERNSGVQYVL